MPRRKSSGSPNPSATASAASRPDSLLQDADGLARLFQCYAGRQRIALAVSGGSDSLALMHLSRAWHRAMAAPKPDLIVLTVDHGLRPVAADEARAVAAAATNVGLACHILTRQAPASQTGIQERARTDRYRLLCEAARAHGADAIATGHTADDQAETLLMRLARGSGVDGLAAMAPVSRIEDVALLRPLLGQSKHALRGVLTELAVTWAEDPSNADPTFERPRLRTPGTTLAAAGLTREPLALSARRLGRARAALEAARDDANRALVTLHPEGWVSLPRAGFEALPEDIRIRLLGFWLAAMGTSPSHPRLSAQEQIVADITTQETVITTLSGCTIIASGDSISIAREPGRGGLPQRHLQPGQTLIWDRRFRVHLPSSAASGVTIRAVLRADLKEFFRHHKLGHPTDYRSLECAPGAFRDGRLVAALPPDIQSEPVTFELVLPDPKSGRRDL
jgi:tRNA(Ile)-lysidine synthase